MGFKQVFCALRDVFPQVDLRILKAVASQYSSDVDVAVEFVLSDVIPAVSEPTEAHYTLQDIDCAKNDHMDSGSSGSFLKKNVSPGYGGPLCTNKKSEEFSQIEDKVVTNETRITPTVDSVQLGASSTSATKPLIDYEQYASAAFASHCAIEKGKMTPKAEKVDNHKHLNGNYDLPDLLISSGGMMPLYTQSPSDCEVIYRGEMPLILKSSKAESTHDFSEPEDYYNIKNLFANVCPTEDVQASKNLLGASTVHTLSESEDNYDSQILFEKEMHLKLSEDECICHFFKSEDNYNLDTLFVGFCSSEDIHTSDSFPGAPTVQILSESADSYDLQVLFEKEIPLKLSTTQSIHDLSKSEDNFDLQVLFENIDSGGKELCMLHSAESTPELHNSEDDLFRKPCSADSTTQLPRFLIKDESQLSSYKLDDQCTFFDLLASSKIINDSSQKIEENDNSYTVHSEEKPSLDSTNPLSFTSICNLNNDFNLSELSSSTPNVCVSDLDSKSEVRDEAEREIMCLNSVDKNSIVPVIVHDTSPHNGMKLIPGADKYEEFVDITTQSYQIDGINKLLSEINNGKEALSSLYGSTTIKMKELELQEENSRKAKQDAVKAHHDFVAMVENFNQLIEISRDSNNKQAQIVHEEKCLLAALAQDLQFRLTELSAERDEALTIVEEIKSDLDARLATLIQEEAAAKEHISQEEKLALLVRKEKEAKMRSIMEESRELQKETEQNIVLRDFLSDRGRIVDILQGEISSIHEKVIALKERSHRSKLESSLITTSSSAISPMADFNSASPEDNMTGNPAKDHEFSDDEWEMLETIQP